DDVAIHHEDEDNDLFPALRRRALPQDALGPVLARLAEDHRRNEGMVADIVVALTARQGDDPVVFDKASREVMAAYAFAEQRHLAMENGVVLAIARVRLTRADVRAMSAAMKARRGVTV
ncbi:MAG: hemerythrin domain-containing protein, partial [Beijerinckiaceae bacterium]